MVKKEYNQEQKEILSGRRKAGAARYCGSTKTNFILL
jgi:hypothetical protein